MGIDGSPEYDEPWSRRTIYRHKVWTHNVIAARLLSVSRVVRSHAVDLDHLNNNLCSREGFVRVARWLALVHACCQTALPPLVSMKNK
eukprot:scaffold50_cov420-Prasinococcus_capsulatus_cf.AAC.1